MPFDDLHPGNSAGRNAPISSSIGRKRVISRVLVVALGPVEPDEPSTLSGTLTRAKCSVPSSGRLHRDGQIVQRDERVRGPDRRQQSERGKPDH